MDAFFIVVLILLNAGLAMSEMALTAARRARLSVRIEAGERGAKVAAQLMRHPTRFLSTVQVGITSIGVLNGIVGEAAFSEPLADALQTLGMQDKLSSVVSTAAVVALITFLTIVFGELVPKRIGQTYPESVATAIAYPMMGLSRIASPFVWLLTHCTSSVLQLLRIDTNTPQEVTHAEINANLAEGLDAGVIDAQEHSLVQNVFALENRPLAGLMRARDTTTYLVGEDALPVQCQKSAKGGHSWYPVLRAAQDWGHVMGVVNTTSLMARYLENPKADADWHDLIQAVRFVPETLSAMELFAQFKQRTERMVLVVDEYGDVQGLITPQDLLEAITGELYTPTQGAAWGAQDAHGTWHLDGQMPVQEFMTRLGIDTLQQKDTAHYSTLGGLVMRELGRVPQVGAQVSVGAWTLRVTQMQGRRVAWVRAEKTLPSNIAPN